ncbi:pentapeptide repeat-containing protein [Dactylosporangium sp. NPDC051541]|uniref:pentapeptide repeat-containing protein n=1 Tax=Dactylosporangium sp. NPDC051541 TaxID=3363977 RepID=UPI00379EAC8E
MNDFVDRELPGARFTNVKLPDAHLTDVDLHGAQFTDVNLRDAHFTNVGLHGARMRGVDLSGGHLTDVDLHGAQFTNVGLRDAHFTNVGLHGARMRGVDLSGGHFIGVDLCRTVIDGDVEGLVINGVDIAPLVEAELDRRDPERVKMRPTTPEGFRAAWDLVELRWSQTVDRARTLPPEKLHESVDGEWSFIETLRHLAFATDCWVRRAILGDPAPWHPLDLPWDQMEDTPGVPRDRAARPTLDEALALRHDRMATVRTLVDSLTPESLAARTTPVHGPGWPPPEAFGVGECLRVVLNEEWYHRKFAERDLAALEA